MSFVNLICSSVSEPKALKQCVWIQVQIQMVQVQDDFHWMAGINYEIYFALKWFLYGWQVLCVRGLRGFPSKIQTIYHLTNWYRILIWVKTSAQLLCLSLNIFGNVIPGRSKPLFLSYFSLANNFAEINLCTWRRILTEWVSFKCSLCWRRVNRKRKCRRCGQYPGVNLG